jgi:2-oxoacid:acceptor oxidoreductase gamma subunit (pyruvate/2-ketoisovalerate family)
MSEEEKSMTGQLIEISIQGRGGQGAVIASKILASSFFMEGKWVQSFPSFGGERRGAPVKAFVRVSDHQILRRSMIYEPDHLLILDASLFEEIDVASGLKPGGWMVINTDKPPSSYRGFTGFNVATVNGSQIAVGLGLGSRVSPVLNTTMLGAFSRATGLIGIDSVAKGICEAILQNTQANVEAAKKAFEEVRMNEQ